MKFSERGSLLLIEHTDIQFFRDVKELEMYPALPWTLQLEICGKAGYDREN